jgi:predicted phosphodiesterase
MRYGVIADVHGNVHALEAVLSRIGRVDGWICAGDLVGYGPKPNECVERIVTLPGLVAVAGNHDLMALDRLPLPRGRLQRKTMEWTRSVASPSTLSSLTELPLRASADGIEITHGSLDDPSEYIYGCDAAREQLARVPDARALVVGHTHLPLECDGRFFNPGSVGQSREAQPLARAMVLELRGSPGVSEPVKAEFLAVDYDVEATRRELRSAGLPPSACHLPPGRLARLRRLVAT